MEIGKRPKCGEIAYTDAEIREIVAAIWDTVNEVTANLYDIQGRPIFIRFRDISPLERNRGFEGLKHRIETEGLQGYIDRKRPAWGEEATDEVIRMLEGRGLL